MFATLFYITVRVHTERMTEMTALMQGPPGPPGRGRPGRPGSPGPQGRPGTPPRQGYRSSTRLSFALGTTLIA